MRRSLGGEIWISPTAKEQPELRKHCIDVCGLFWAVEAGDSQISRCAEQCLRKV